MRTGTSTTKSIHELSPELNESSSSSSEGESSEGINVDCLSASDDNTNIDPVLMSTKPAKPHQMKMQVGGIAAHKRPMMALDNFILKPLSFSDMHTHLGIVNKHKFKDDETATNGIGNNQELNGVEHAAHGRIKDGVIDTAKSFRGIREVAFYETLAYASSIPSLLPVVRNNDHLCNNEKAEISWAVLRLLSLYKNGASACSMQQSSYSTLVDFCRHTFAMCHLHRYWSNSFHLGHFETMVLVAAYCAGDPVVVPRIQSYARAWRALINELEALKQLTQFTAPYFGVVHLDGLEGYDKNQPMQNPHLLLQNLTAPLSQPNIIDIKMGTRTYEPTASFSKQISQAAKYPRQFKNGFRIVGMGIHMPDGTYRYWDKRFGVSLKREDDVIAALMAFFHCNNATSDKEYIRFILGCVIQQLNQIKHWFEEINSSLSFYASSILIAYENSGQGEDVTFSTRNRPIVKMIDFAHVCRWNGGDFGYLKGVRNLLKILYEIHGRITQ